MLFSLYSTIEIDEFEQFKSREEQWDHHYGIEKMWVDQGRQRHEERINEIKSSTREEIKAHFGDHYDMLAEKSDEDIKKFMLESEIERWQGDSNNKTKKQIEQIVKEAVDEWEKEEKVKLAKYFGEFGDYLYMTDDWLKTHED